MSDLNEKRAAKANARKAKSALALSTQLAKSVKAMQEFINACNDCGDNKVLNADDGRQLLKGSMDEYGHWLSTAYST